MLLYVIVSRFCDFFGRVVSMNLSFIKDDLTCVDTLFVP